MRSFEESVEMKAVPYSLASVVGAFDTVGFEYYRLVTIDDTFDFDWRCCRI